MNNNPSYEQTLEFIQKWHSGQLRDDGQPFWTHPHKCFEYALNNKHDNYEICTALLLHDLLEDTSCVSKDLLDAGYNQYIVNLVESVTHSSNKDKYPNKFSYYKDKFTNCQYDTLWIKLIDRLCNLKDIEQENIWDHRRQYQYCQDTHLLLQILFLESIKLGCEYSFSIFLEELYPIMDKIMLRYNRHDKKS